MSACFFIDKNNQFAHILNFYLSETSENIMFSDYKNNSSKRNEKKSYAQNFVLE